MTKSKSPPPAGRRRSEFVTAHDVARRVGVSAMTVSRVVAGAKNVGVDTRKRVLAAVQELNYRPNTAARTLASAMPARVGLLYSNPSNAYLSALLVGALDEMSRRGSQLIIADCAPGDARSERRAVRGMLKGQIAGILLPPPLCESPAVLAEIAAAGSVAVGIAMGEASAKISCVRIDDRKAAYDMTNHLIQLGHRRIGFIAGHPNQKASAQRQAGFERAMSEAGPGMRPGIVQGYFSFQSGLEAAEQLLDRKSRPSAIFASNDDMAAAAISVAHRRGLETPGDISIAGFDDTAIATTVWPELTTIRQPIAEMAARAVDLLHTELQQRKAGIDFAMRDIVMPHELVERGSVAGVRV
jgi:LacI family transcriptional regulator